eukprot:gnl/TRDRNA2_/TRDRNA2_193765_c0_seq1.p1 gnl/TRDRNA2_/TRDRNA2_193765_c0~~gnl/TRDRNA2_/TRDRNA2_193765_c0_seq1.p1  ORF type:complete len:215 (+),score=36.91 gnl/TRDRNA2_/TRDRNA2_193765_c0_seq1:86-730(+)
MKMTKLSSIALFLLYLNVHLVWGCNETQADSCASEDASDELAMLQVPRTPSALPPSGTETMLEMHSKHTLETETEDSEMDLNHLMTKLHGGRTQAALASCKCASLSEQQCKDDARSGIPLGCQWAPLGSENIYAACIGVFCDCSLFNDYECGAAAGCLLAANKQDPSGSIFQQQGHSNSSLTRCVDANNAVQRLKDALEPLKRLNQAFMKRFRV